MSNQYEHIGDSVFLAGSQLDFSFTDRERLLLVALLEERVTNIEGHKAAIAAIPDLATVADEGWRELDGELEVCRSALEELAP